MFNDLLTIVPARRGSKRFPGKNTIDFFGKPLIAWSIEAALNSRYVDEVLISTDDLHTANIAKEYGAVFTGLRPAYLSNDDVNLIDVVIYHVNNLAKIPEYVMLLQPTSPLRDAMHIDEAFEIISDLDFDAVISVSRVSKPNQWQFPLEVKNNLSLFNHRKINIKQSQQFAPEFTFNGAIYIAKTNRLLDEKTFLLSSRCKAYEMPFEVSIDIDTQLDLVIAKALHLGVDFASKKLCK